MTDETKATRGARHARPRRDHGAVDALLISANRRSLGKDLYRDRYLYLFLVPVVAFYIVFRYLPLGGLIIAFKDYRLNLGILGSPWVGFKHFERLFAAREFYRVVRNTLVLNVYGLVAGFPAPIILAILLNEVRNLKYKKAVQTMLYLPHFISWVVLGGIIINLLSPSSGIVNHALDAVFGVRIFFMGSSAWWPTVYVMSGIWQGAGWGTIIYLAAISGIDPQLYEASIIDGANKLRQIRHITIPGITSTIFILLIL
ncbi:MAG TPA: ABC transporter permease subunit, partial [Spirochaetia bacterium]|nr:ABC transporter permease subunit [Spirochaetia bacterium]